jgi:hypothetical protein
MKSKVKITRTGEARQESQNITVRIGHLRQNNLDRTAGTGQTWQVSLDRSAYTGQWTGWPGHDSEFE